MSNALILWSLLTVITFIIIYRYFYSETDIPNKKTLFSKIAAHSVYSIIVLLLSGITSGFFLAMTFSIGIAVMDKEERVDSSYELVSLETNEDIHGSYSNLFFVGSGYIGEDLYYHFFYKTSKGTKYKKIKAENCYIIETDSIPSYTKYALFLKDTDSFFYEVSKPQESRQVLYIPKGTIKANYKVN